MNTDPESASGHRELIADYERARAHFAQGETDQAIDLFFDLSLRDPMQARFQLALGLCFQHQGRLEDAGRHYSHAFVLDPSNAACAYRLGECLANLGHVPDARDALQAALQLCELPGADGRVREQAGALLDRLR